MHKWDPKDYSENSSAQFNFAKLAIERLELKGDECILDLGCGDGKITKEIAELVPAGKVKGIDASAEMIEFARQKFPPAQFPNLSFEKMDAQEINYKEAFDLVFSNSALHWVPDQKAVLKGVCQSLKPGGRVFFQMAGKGNLDDLGPVVIKVLPDPRWKDVFKGFKSPWGFFEPEQYKKWVIESGLKPIRVELVPRQMTHQGRGALIGWIRTTWLPLLSRIPDEHEETFIVSLADTYIEMHKFDPRGIITVPAMRLEVEAEKPKNRD